MKTLQTLQLSAVLSIDFAFEKMSEKHAADVMDAGNASREKGETATLLCAALQKKTKR